MKFYKEKKNNDFKVGLFTLIGLTILVLCYVWLTEMMENRNYTHLHVAFKNAGNTEVGNPVTINGVKKGRVEKIEVFQDGVILQLKVQLDFPLKEGTKFHILESSLMGDIQVEILPGNGQKNLDITKVQNGKRQIGLTTLVANLGDMVVGLEAALDKIYGKANLIDDIHSVMDTTGVILNKFNMSYDKNSALIEELISNANQVTAKLNAFLAANQDNLTHTIGKTSLLVTEIEQTMNKIQDITIDLKNISAKMNNDDNSFNRMISEEDLYNNLLKTTAHLDSLILDIKKNPKKYFEIKVF
jgi:phospholipid/cholesterol/gamma-HCH transport system substrate-binding protein